MTDDLSAYDGAAQDAYTAFHNTACGWEGLDEEERQCWRYAARAAILWGAQTTASDETLPAPYTGPPTTCSWCFKSLLPGEIVRCQSLVARWGWRTFVHIGCEKATPVWDTYTVTPTDENHGQNPSNREEQG